MEIGFEILRMDSMVGICDLPEELVAKILLELLIESLLCVKGVQKSWYHLIKNKTLFVTDHLLKQTNTGTSSTCSLLIFDYYLHSTPAERNMIVDEFIRICNSNDSEIEHVQSIIQMVESRFCIKKYLKYFCL